MNKSFDRFVISRHNDIFKTCMYKSNFRVIVIFERTRNGTQRKKFVENLTVTSWILDLCTFDVFRLSPNKFLYKHPQSSDVRLGNIHGGETD